MQVSRAAGGGRDVSFSARCSKGTYVRALARDLVRPTPRCHATSNLRAPIDRLSHRRCVFVTLRQTRVERICNEER